MLYNKTLASIQTSYQSLKWAVFDYILLDVFHFSKQGNVELSFIVCLYSAEGDIKITMQDFIVSFIHINL